MFDVDEPQPQSPEEAGTFWCRECQEYIPLADGLEHAEYHYEMESLDKCRPFPKDPVIRAFYEGMS